MEQTLNPDLYEFVVAESNQDREKIYDSRLYNYHGDCDYLLQNNNTCTHPGKDPFDDQSILFYVSYMGEVAASSRCTSYGRGEWEISGSLTAPLPFSPDSSTFVQFNRVLVDPRFRKSSLHELMFLWCSRWMKENTGFTSYFAVCKPMLLRFYMSYGATRIPADPVKLAGRGDSEYYFVQGDIDRTARLLEENLKRKNIYQTIKTISL